MSDTARDYQKFEPVTTDGLDDLFQATPGVTQVIPCEVDGVFEGVTEENIELLTLAEAARRFGIPYTTFYKQVKAGKHETTAGSDGKPRVIYKGISDVTPGVTYSIESETPVTLGVSPREESVTQVKHLEMIDQLMGKLEAANYRIGWLESQVRERESDVQELKLLVDSQYKSSWWAGFKKWFLGH